MLELKDYQRASLDTLTQYFEAVIRLDAVSNNPAQLAFAEITKRPYHIVSTLPQLPYVCLRVPTGGGKTLMACHALGIAAKQLLQSERAACVWLVPTNTIREQTLAALRNRQHAYRQALDARFGGQVQVMDLAEALSVQRGVLEGTTCIMVSTLAALRVQDTEGRKVYEAAGALSHHFSGLDGRLDGLLERDADGAVPHSLANVLRLWRPVVIMDEAHNARTPLSFETLARVNPSCVIEFTATPEVRHNPQQELVASNVLHHVSARELKAEHMVKLPIKLQVHPDWREVVARALETQRALTEQAEAEARVTGEYIRPLILFQAQPRHQHRETLTPEELKRALMEDFKVPETQIAVATGETKEIEDVNLFDPACPVRCIITVQALREGWDCSFAYVLCSLAETAAARGVEQILGRIMRLPRATQKQASALNCAYAFAVSSHFPEVAAGLRDALVDNGFERLETQEMVQQADYSDTLFDGAAKVGQVTMQISAAPDLTTLSPALRHRVAYDPATHTMSVSGSALQPTEQRELRRCVQRPEDQAAMDRLSEQLQRVAVALPAQPGSPAPFIVPQLAIRVDGQLELFEADHFLDVEWDLAQCDAALAPADIIDGAHGEAAEIDVTDAGDMRYHQVQQLQEQRALLLHETGWTTAALANWLDRQLSLPLRHQLTQAQSSLFIHRALTGLQSEHGMTLEQLVRHKHRLAKAVERKIAQHRASAARDAYQQLLFGRGSEIEVSPVVCFAFSDEEYAPNWAYEPRGYDFDKHDFSLVGELDSEGEEFDCAVFIDGRPEVKRWVRNVPKARGSFWLQTSTDKFYPDFVAELQDGRILVIEYKNATDWSNDDSKEKRAVGALWADRSNGRCLFFMPQGPDWSALVAAMASATCSG